MADESPTEEEEAMTSKDEKEAEAKSASDAESSSGKHKIQTGKLDGHRDNDDGQIYSTFRRVLWLALSPVDNN